jgi:Ino eighty subunit 2
MSSRASRRSEGKSAAASVSRGPPSSPSDSNPHVHLTVKLPASKLRQATTSRPAPPGRQSTRDSFSGGEIIEGKRNRSQKKSYVVETSDDDEEDAPGEIDEEDDEDAEGEDDDMMDDDEEDAEGEIVVDDTMDMDAEGEDDDEGDEDAEGEDDDMDMDIIPPPAPVIKVSKPSTKSSSSSKPRGAMKPAAAKASASQVKGSEDDDEELSELESDADEIQDTVKVGGGDEEDAEGEDEEMEEAEPAEDDDLGSDEDGSQAETPDLTKMTKRQRARFEENGDAALMKLSDGRSCGSAVRPRCNTDFSAEVQAKKHFTAEELSMRRAEMARRRRNLSEKRNEEVKVRPSTENLLARETRGFFFLIHFLLG